MTELARVPDLPPQSPQGAPTHETGHDPHLRIIANPQAVVEHALQELASPTGGHEKSAPKSLHERIVDAAFRTPYATAVTPFAPEDKGGSMQRDLDSGRYVFVENLPTLGAFFDPHNTEANMPDGKQYGNKDYRDVDLYRTHRMRMIRRRLRGNITIAKPLDPETGKVARHVEGAVGVYAPYAVVRKAEIRERAQEPKVKELLIKKSSSDKKDA